LKFYLKLKEKVLIIVLSIIVHRTEATVCASMPSFVPKAAVSTQNVKRKHEDIEIESASASQSGLSSSVVPSSKDTFSVSPELGLIHQLNSMTTYIVHTCMPRTIPMTKIYLIIIICSK
jgi:hypothetical protein